MGYHVIDPSDVEPLSDRPSETRDVGGAAGLENVGLRRYVVAPGEDVPLSGLHYHDEQEEVFYVVSGELRVETPDREFVVEADQFFVAEPKSPHRAFNAADSTDDAVVVAVGAPSVMDGHRYEE